MMVLVIYVVFAAFMFQQYSLIANCLSPLIDHYETLNYAPIQQRSRRSIDDRNGAPLNLQFRSHNRDFHLILHPIDDQSADGVFAAQHIVDVNDETVDDVRIGDFLYSGYVKDDPGSTAYGSVFDGIFDGHIHLSDGTSFGVEKAARYLPRPHNFHSIIYSDAAINHTKARPKRKVDEPSSILMKDHSDQQHTCGLSDSVAEWMHKVQTSAAVDDQHYIEDDRPSLHSFPERYLNREKRQYQAHDYEEVHGRRLYKVRTCSMYLQADQKLYEHIKSKEGNNDAIRTREEIVSLFYNHIKAVNHIYETTNFNGITGLNFVIQRTSIFTPDTCDKGRPTSTADNPFCEDNVDVSNFLNLNSQRNHSSFCLSYVLTYRDFVGGTLGLAWVASPNTNTAGGVCQIYQKYNEGTRGWVYRSLNTGIITLVNYGNRVPTRVSQLTLAHEIGHNFGSPHDFPVHCQPGLPDGNYIMFASATSGDKSNNAKFSQCSISNISSVLQEVLKQIPVDPQKHLSSGAHGKRNCFQERLSAFCGNQIKEPGEQCDCGFTSKDCDDMGDQCCVPHENNGMVGSSSGGCRRKAGMQCSPSEGQCCNSLLCKFHNTSQPCRTVSDCLNMQYCDGRGPVCPDSQPKPDGLPCQDSTKVCQGGNCNGSVCAQVGLRDCFLTQGSPEDLCHLACEKAGKCVSSFDLPEFDPSIHNGSHSSFKQKGREDKKGLLLHPGSPCNNYQGYCDIFRKCRSVDSNGPLARLKNLLFNKETIKTVSEWIQEHWWAVVLMGIVLMIVMALFVKCCAVHTPSTNPNKAPAQSFYETLRRPQTLIRRPHQHQQQQQRSAHTSRSAAVNNSNAASASHGGRRPRSNARRHRASSHDSASTAAPIISDTPQMMLPPPSLAPMLNAPAVPPPNVIVVEPPPPYSAAADPSSALGGPPRGHRKHKKQSDSAAKAKRRP